MGKRAQGEAKAGILICSFWIPNIILQYVKFMYNNYFRGLIFYNSAIEKNFFLIPLYLCNYVQIPFESHWLSQEVVLWRSDIFFISISLLFVLFLYYYLFYL